MDDFRKGKYNVTMIKGNLISGNKAGLKFTIIYLYFNCT